MGLSGCVSLLDPERVGPALRSATFPALLRQLATRRGEAGVRTVCELHRPFVAALPWQLGPWAAGCRALIELFDAIEDAVLGDFLAGVLRPGESIPDAAFVDEPTYLDLIDGRGGEATRDALTQAALADLGLGTGAHRSIGDSIHYVVLGRRHTAELIVLCRIALRDAAAGLGAALDARDPLTRETLEALAAMPVDGRTVLVEAAV